MTTNDNTNDITPDENKFLTIEEIKELSDSVTQGNWNVQLENSVFSVRVNDMVLVEEPSAGFSLQLTKGEAYLPVDLNLMAAAPTLAKQYIHLFEHYQGMTEECSELKKENQRLQTIIEKQRSALNLAHGYIDGVYGDVPAIWAINQIKEALALTATDTEQRG